MFVGKAESNSFIKVIDYEYVLKTVVSQLTMLQNKLE
jgi:hypothetical protein